MLDRLPSGVLPDSAVESARIPILFFSLEGRCPVRYLLLKVGRVHGQT